MPGPLQYLPTLLPLLFLTPGSSSADDTAWTPMGERDHVAVADANAITLTAIEPTTAGALSPPLNVAPTTEAVLVEADITGADPRAVTFTVHDAVSGTSIGYWTNPLPARNTTRIAAVLPLAATTPSIRVFAGTHGQPSNATIADVVVTALHRTMNHDGAVYGALVSPKHHIRQTFRATGEQLGAIVFRIRQLKGYGDGPDLAVRLYAWRENMATTTKAKPLAETIVSRQQIPGTLQGVTKELDLSATYLGGARELAVPLRAATKPGDTYVVELALAGPGTTEQGFLAFAWLDSYADGELYENNSTRGRRWDLRLEVYHVAR